MEAKLFATVENNMIVTITDATPPQELEDNQFPLTKMEWDLLHYLPAMNAGGGIDLVGSREMINKFLSKIQDIQDAKSRASI